MAYQTHPICLNHRSGKLLQDRPWYQDGKKVMFRLSVVTCSDLHTGDERR